MPQLSFLWWHNRNTTIHHKNLHYITMIRKRKEKITAIGLIPFVRLAIMSTIPDSVYFFSVEMLSGVRALDKIDSYYWSCTACYFSTYMLCSGSKNIISFPENWCSQTIILLLKLISSLCEIRMGEVRALLMRGTLGSLQSGDIALMTFLHFFKAHRPKKKIPNQNHCCWYQV